MNHIFYTGIPKLLLATAFFCSVMPASYAAAAAVQTEPAATAPGMRLGDLARPLAYRAELQLTPAKEDFQGRIEIDLKLQRVSRTLWLHGRQLQIKRAEILQEGRRHSAQVQYSGADLIGLQFDAALAAGAAQLQIEYSGAVSARDTAGLFRQEDGGEWYLLSQFETDDARRAFPCFDEPQWKTPWQISIIHAPGLVAASNMPLQASEKLADGRVRSRFLNSPPMSSYLLALGLGPFDVVDGGTAGRRKTPLRYLVPKGRAAEASYAQQTTPRVLELAEEYFDMAYPYPKLDSMVLPVTVNFGAMENIGLITYRSGIMLAPKGQEGRDFKQKYVSIAAHEISHQWFGDLVTPQWWDDIWLNESFASWLTQKLYARFEPAWATPTEGMHERKKALEHDRLPGARQMQRKVEREDDLASVFDAISYDKGASVLRMTEQYMGEQAFRTGVRRYIRRHAMGNASAQDFFQALAHEQKDLAPALASFVQQAGAPLLEFSLQCDKQPRLQVQQRRFSPLDGADANGANWRIPLCLRWPGAKGEQQSCQIIQGRSQEIVLKNAQQCPAWVQTNPGGDGYYLSVLDGALLQGMAHAPLSPRARMVFNQEQAMLAENGVSLWAPWLQQVAQQSAAASDDLLLSLLQSVQGVRADWFNPQAKGKWSAWLQRQFGARAQQLGWLAQAQESESTQQLREHLLLWLVQQDAAPELQAGAQQLVQNWLQARRQQLAGQKDAPAPQQFGAMLRHVLAAAAVHASPEMVRQMQALAAHTPDRREKYFLYRALGMSRAPELLRQNLENMLAPQVDVREASVTLWQAAEQQPAAGRIMLDFLQQHSQTLLQRSPEHYAASLVRISSGFCSQELRRQSEAVFTPLLKNTPGGEHNLQQALQSMDICIANRARQAASMQEWLLR